ncbi:MAG TPA: choice-of-anchor tandem repeat GloVer-containing protein [Candidatus Acidoferrum sp.]|nr:choice-of-anchor tandem repeat GloVer-containing protein [Candidatus Acidoferrum sp.]
MTTRTSSLSISNSSISKLVLVLVLIVSAASAFAVTGKTVHSFVSLANGANPQSGLIEDSAGNFYGTTSLGGAHGFGEVFELSPTSGGKFIQTVLYSFAGAPLDGALPYANLTLDSAGNFYGTTSSGGNGTVANCGNGCGTVFKLAPKSGGGWTETVIFNFLGGGAGSQPTGGVIFDSAGNLYGAAPYTYYYGGYGLVFKLSPSSPNWTETTLYTFTGGADGAYPSTTPVFDNAGNLYGTTTNASGGYNGVVYEVSPGSSGWTQKVIHSFRGYPYEGALPRTGLIIDSAGNLFGTASGGGTCSSNGTVFELSPSSGGTWTAKQLYCFKNGSNDGVIPEGAIAFDSAGNLYGSTLAGGTNGYGIVYQLTPRSSGNWAEHVIKNFSNGIDGSEPIGGVLVDSSGKVYATAFQGASLGCQYSNFNGNGCGTVIQLTPRNGGPWLSTTISHFTSTDSAIPLGSLISDSSGNYYGTASQSGSFGAGEVFRLTRSASGIWTKAVLYDFTGANGDGIYPSGNLVFDKSGNLYGTTQFGGNTDYCSNGLPGCGIVYELSPSGSGPWKEKILYTFQVAVGGAPTAGLIFDSAGNLYGTTQQGGQGQCPAGALNNCGMVFELSPAAGGAWTETTLYQFTGGNDGGNPFGGVVMDSAGNLFGTAQYAGSNYLGTAFELSPGTGGVWTFNVIHTGGSVNGDFFYPNSGFVLDSAGNLYGTGQGPTGSFDVGVVYKLSPAVGSWTTTILYAFTGSPDGNNPWGGVTLNSAGNLYGTTWYGGKSANCQFGCGTIFSLAPSGSGWTETQLHSFNAGNDGAYPQAGAIVDSAGDVFTTTSSGGSGHQGTVFEVVP